jgi:quercetin dioxygenase-like cupin family protein
MTTSQTALAQTSEYMTVADGVEIRFVRREAHAATFFIRMKKGARAPRHGHPGGEETCVVEGALCINRRVDAAGEAQPDLVIRAGEYAFAPPGETHEGVALEDTVFFVVAAGGVVPTSRGLEGRPREAAGAAPYGPRN